VLVSRTVTGLRGLYALERLSLRTGAVHHGPVFPPSPAGLISLVPASGYLWVSELPASSSQPVVTQVSLRNLAVIRSLRLPKVTGACSPAWPSLQAPRLGVDRLLPHAAPPGRR